MAETTSTVTVQLTVRYFAAARAAANAETETVQIEPGTTVAALVNTLGARGPELARVLCATRPRSCPAVRHSTCSRPSPADECDLHHITKWSQAGYDAVTNDSRQRKRPQLLRF